MSHKQNEGQLNKCVQLHLLQFSTRTGIFTFSLETVKWPNHSNSAAQSMRHTKFWSKSLLRTDHHGDV